MDRRILWGLGAVAFMGVAAYAGHATAQRRRRVRELDPAFDELDEVDEDEPAYIQYDQRLPCVTDEVEFMARDADEDGEGCIHPKDLEALTFREVPFAEGDPIPAWPLATRHPRDPQVSYVDVREKWHGKWGREFGASRKSTNRQTGETTRRYHAGIDLFAEEGDEVRAMEDGEVIAILPFHHGAWAIYVLNDTGDVVNYGEVEKGSQWRYGVQVGSRITKGQKIARLGKMRTDTMLHIETYEPVAGIEQLVDDIRKKRLRWRRDEDAPMAMLDPTEYLLDAQHAALEG